MAPHEARVVAIFGPTGVGKTGVALALADVVVAGGGEAVAISADALQVYSGLELLTGAPTAAESRRLEHRLVGVADVSQTFSVGMFMPLAHAEIDAALERGRRPIVVGGTGLYLRAALCRLDLAPAPPAAVRARLEAEGAARGAPALHAALAARAPDVARAIEPTDRARVVRALELLELGHHDGRESRETGSQLWSEEVRHPTLLVGLVMERQRLRERIDARVDAMVAAGAAAAVRAAERRGASRTARRALGYEELLAGDVEGMKRRTRRYARRQLTWMRKLAGVETIDVTDRTPEDVAVAVARRAGWETEGR